MSEDSLIWVILEAGVIMMCIGLLFGYGAGVEDCVVGNDSVSVVDGGFVSCINGCYYATRGDMINGSCYRSCNEVYGGEE